MDWDGPIVTDSGGFQVFSMGHGTVADEIKGRRRGHGEASGARGGDPLDRRARSALSLLRRRRRALPLAGGLDGGAGRRCARTSRSCSTSAPPSTSTATTPSARPSAPTAGWSAACAGTPSTAPPAQLVYGIVQGGVYEDMRRASARTVAASGCDGIAIGGSLGAEKAADVRGRRLRGRRAGR